MARRSSRPPPLSASAVMPGRSNSHVHGQSFVLPVAPETSLTSPFCGAESTATIARDTMHVTSRVRQRKTQGKTKVSTVVVVVDCGGGGGRRWGGVGRGGGGRRRGGRWREDKRRGGRGERGGGVWWCGPCVHGESLSMNHDHATNSGGRIPGSKLPASPPPLHRPDGGCQPWPCTCVHGL